jgi:hypothetical protein
VNYGKRPIREWAKFLKQKELNMAEAASKKEMNDTTMMILQRAVILARDRNIQRIAILRKHLSIEFPDQEKDIEKAIQAWASRIRQVN